MKEQTDLTICIYHGGFECDLESGETLSQTTENVGYRICKELDFDILLTGHQHMSVTGRDISGTYTVQPCDNAKEYQYLEVTMTDHEKSIRSGTASVRRGKGNGACGQVSFHRKCGAGMAEPADRSFKPRDPAGRESENGIVRLTDR